MTTVLLVLAAWVFVSFLCGGLLLWRKSLGQTELRPVRQIFDQHRDGEFRSR
jgi:hypothetical protein